MHYEVRIYFTDSAILGVCLGCHLALPCRLVGLYFWRYLPRDYQNSLFKWKVRLWACSLVQLGSKGGWGSDREVEVTRALALWLAGLSWWRLKSALIKCEILTFILLNCYFLFLYVFFYGVWINGSANHGLHSESGL